VPVTLRRNSTGNQIPDASLLHCTGVPRRYAAAHSSGAHAAILTIFRRS